MIEVRTIVDRRPEGVFRTVGSELIFAYFCSATKVGPAERKKENMILIRCAKELAKSQFVPYKGVFYMQLPSGGIIKAKPQ